MADITTCPPLNYLNRASVEEAAKRIGNKAHRTPALSSSYIDQLASTPQTAEALKDTPWEGQEPAKPQLHILFKCENLQRIGAFKIRGAFNALLRYHEESARRSDAEKNGQKPVRIISHSSGNHAQAVSLAATELGYPVHIVMPSNSALAKIAATRGYGAQVHFSGQTPQERLAIVAELMEDTSFDNVFVPPYDHPDTLLGQGTMGLEFQEQAPELLPSDQKLNGLIAPCGGGGMLSGVALSCQGTGITVFGAEPSKEGADDCRRGLLQGKRIEQVQSSTIADGLRTPVGEIPWSVISDPKLVRGVFAVTDEQICSAFKLVLQRMKVVIEPSSATPLAVALYNEEFRRIIQQEQEFGRVFNLGLIVSGGNVDLDALPKVLALAK